MRDSEMWREMSIRDTDWLDARDPGGSATGYDPGSRPDSAWVLHAMYEKSDPAGLDKPDGQQLEQTMTYDELHQHLLQTGARKPDTVNGVDLEVGVVTGSGLGSSRHPGPGWRRLRWAELAARVGDPIVPEGIKPSYRCFPGKPSVSWPINIRPPSEGSLDQEGWNRLIELLAQWSPSNVDTYCFAFFSAAQNAWDNEGCLLFGRLGDAPALYDSRSEIGAPANFWAADRSWVTWSGWDLWGTKVAAPPAFIETLLNDEELEAIRLPWC